MSGRTAIAIWALLVGAYSAALWVVGVGSLQPVLLSGAALAGLVVALAAGVFGRAEPASRTLPDSSLPTVLVVIGLVMVLNGFAFGLWLALLGAQLAALGAFLLIREMRRGSAER